MSSDQPKPPEGLVDRLRHFERNQIESGDEYGAEVLHRATEEIARLARERDEVRADAARLLEALEVLSTAERHYRDMYQCHGGQALDTGRAWDMLRKAGIEARAVLAKVKETNRTLDSERDRDRALIRELVEALEGLQEVTTMFVDDYDRSSFVEDREAKAKAALAKIPREVMGCK